MSVLIHLSMLIASPAQAQSLTLDVTRPAGVIAGVRDPSDPLLHINDGDTLTQRVRAVLLDACEGAVAGDRFSWELRVHIDGGEGPWEDTSRYTRYADDSCAADVQVPFEGDWEFKVTRGDQAATQLVEVRDLWMVSLGDSFSSGEGAADTLDNDGKYEQFQDHGCHRSAFGWPHRVAEDLVVPDGTQLLFTYLACSGAKLDNGIRSLSGGQWTFDGPENLFEGEAQVDALDAIQGATQPDSVVDATRFQDAQLVPDAIVMTGGGNDAGFGTVVSRCMEEGLEELGDFLTFQWFDNGHCDDTLWAYLAPDIEETQWTPIEARYHALDADLGALGLLPLSADGQGDGVFVLEYPDLTRDSAGEIDDCFSTISMEEDHMQVAHDHILVPLNEHIADAASANEWTFMNGTMKAFSHNGVCAEDNWINTVFDSWDDQSDVDGGHDKNGTMHPNRTGFEEMSEVALPFVQDHVDGIDRDARVPDVSLVVAQQVGGPVAGQLFGDRALTIDVPEHVDVKAYVDDIEHSMGWDDGLFTLDIAEPAFGTVHRTVRIERTWNPLGVADGVPLPDHTVSFDHANRSERMGEVLLQAHSPGSMAQIGLEPSLVVDGGVYLGEVVWTASHPELEVVLTVRGPDESWSDYHADPIWGGQANSADRSSSTTFQLLKVDLLDADGDSIYPVVVPFAVVAAPEDLFVDHVPAYDVLDDVAGQPWGMTRAFDTLEWFTVDEDLDRAWSGAVLVPDVDLHATEHCEAGNEWCLTASATIGEHQPTEGQQLFPVPTLAFGMRMNGEPVVDGAESVSETQPIDYTLVTCLNAAADCKTGSGWGDGASLDVDTVTLEVHPR